MKRCVQAGLPAHGRRMMSKLSPDELAERLRLDTLPPKVEFGTLDPSVIPTEHFQKSLLRLPIPKLDDTCRNYIETVKPLLSPDELKATQAIVEKFRTTEGPSLHAKLVARDKINSHTSYITDDWFDMYLSARSPLPLNWSPFLVFRKDPTDQRNTQAFRAAAFVHASLQFKELYKSGKMAPEVFHMKPKVTKAPWYQRLAAMTPRFASAYVMMAQTAFPLDMSQFPRLFNSTRIPHAGKDELRSGESDHIIVFHKGWPYKVNVYATKSRGSSLAPVKIPLSVDQIAARLQSIVFDTADTHAEYPVGALTSDDRDKWAALRRELEMDPKNKEKLSVIDSAIFAVCLDDENADFTSQENVAKMGRQFLHGDPKQSNRWWDKSFSLLVSRNGYVSCNFEHSWGDGVAVMRWANDAWNTSCESTALPKQEDPTEKPEKITFELNDTLKNGIQSSVARFQTQVDSLRYDVSIYPDIGKQGLKKMRVSPDAFMQQAFQVAFKRLYNETRCTYESASTSAFRGGRTEAIRAATVESQNYATAMMDSNVSASKRYELLQAAMKKHQDITKAALMGKGIDRHLFGLRKIAERSGTDMPEIFADRGYLALNENIISTSTLYNDCLCMGGFGPVHAEGLGLGYSPAPNLLFLGTTSYTRDPRAYSEAVWESVDEMKWLLENHKK